MKKLLIKILKILGLYNFAKLLISGLRKLSPNYFRQNKLMADFYSGFIKKGDLCFDIGANIGNRTDVFLKLGATVVAVEPQDECMRKLENKYKNNPRVILVKKGLDEKTGEKKILINRENTLSSFSEKWFLMANNGNRFGNSEWIGEKIIPMTTMDNLIDKYGKPNFCKIDVEGYELNVLKGLTEPIHIVSFEFVPELINSTIECINYLTSLGDAVFNYTIGEAMELALDVWVDAADIIKILENLPDKKIFGDIYVRFNLIN